MTADPKRFIQKFRTLQELASWAQLYEEDARVLVVNKFGQNRDLDTAVQEDLWSQGATRAYPDTLETFECVSSNAADAAAGTGARTVEVSGLDSNYNLISEIITLNGTTDVTTVNSYYNIHKIKVLTAGSGGVNAGALTVTGTSSSNILAGVSVGFNVTQMSHYMIPAGYVGFILSETLGGYRADVSGVGRVELTRNVQDFGGVKLKTSTVGLQSNSFSIEYVSPPRYNAKTLIHYTGISSTNNCAASIEYTLLMIKEELVS